MKQYKELISEIAFVKKILSDYKSKKELYAAIEDIEKRYPGVNHFLYAASQWASEVSPEENKELYNLLVKMSGKSSVKDFTEQEIRTIYKYIVKNRLRGYDSFESHFIEATENDQ